MKYLHSSMMGSHYIPCTRDMSSPDVYKITYTDPISDETVTRVVDFDEIHFEMADSWPNILEFTKVGDLSFNPPVVVGWDAREPVEEPNDDAYKIGYIAACYVLYYYFDFGMEGQIFIDEGFSDGFGLTDKNTDKEHINAYVLDALNRAFNVDKTDPESNYFHWALYGNLKNRIV